MIIGVDAGALSIGDKRLQVGVYQVTVNLLQQLATLDKKNNYLLYTFAPINEKLLASFGSRMQNIVIKPEKGWGKLWLPLRVVKDKPDVFLALNQMPLSFKPKKTRVIGLFHDLAFEYFPEMYPGSLTKLRVGSRKLAQQASALIAVSQATKKDIEKFYYLPSNNITVAYEGIRNLPKAAKGNTKNPYFLFVGALKRQKNIPAIIQAFAGLDAKVDLVIVGGDTWLDPEIHTTLNSLPAGIKDRVIFKAFVIDQELAYLYSHAIALVNPSVYEGFGLTLVEAMSLGCPVIAGNTGSQTEVVGKAGILVEPGNIQALQNAMEKMLKNSTDRQHFSSLGKQRAKMFSWESFAKAIFSIIGE